MARSVIDKIRADGKTTGIFLKKWGITVTRYPLGDLGAPQSVLAVWMPDEETQPGQDPGGIAVQDISGENIPRKGVLEVTELQTVDDRDIWGLPNYDGGPNLKWKALRIVGRDAGMKSFAMQRIDDVAISRVSRR